MEADGPRQRLEAALAELTHARYDLTLFVSGASSSSARAVSNAQALCKTHLAGRCKLTIVDIHQEPELARGHRVLATPTLLKTHPAPKRMLVGDLSDEERVLLVLGERPGARSDARAGG